MNTTITDEESLKNAVKSAIVELVQERPNVLRDLFEEILQDVALGRAIREGEESPLVSREEVFEILEPAN